MIYQISDSLNYGDGVGNIMIYLSRLMSERGYENCLCAKHISDEYIRKNDPEMYRVIEGTNELLIGRDDLVLYHFASGNVFNQQVERLTCRKILIYHNVTPPGFFRGYNVDATLACLWGEYDARYTVGNYIAAMAMSEFSKSDLVRMGWSPEAVSVFPIVSIEGNKALPNKRIMNKYGDGNHNLLFIGRVAPNKKHEDIIRIFKYYKDNYDPDSRLLLVGSLAESIYVDALEYYIEQNDIRDVKFTGRATDGELKAYYKTASVFICMSEHEGLCIPVLEAMNEGVPVLAYKAAAVPDTMGNAGILTDTKDEKAVAEIIHRLISDEAYRKEIIEHQHDRVESISMEAYADDIIALIDRVEKVSEWKYVFEDKGLPLRPIERKVPFEKSVIFTDEGKSDNYCLSGFSAAEDHGRWTIQKEAVLLFEVPHTEQGIVCSILCGAYQKSQEVQLNINGYDAGSILVSERKWYQIFIPFEYIKSDMLYIKMNLLNLKSPYELGDSEDRRKLGISLSEIIFNDKPLTSGIRKKPDYSDSKVGLRGFSWAESEGIWTDGKEAEVTLYIDGDRDRDVVLFYDIFGKKQDISLYLNGRHIEDYTENNTKKDNGTKSHLIHIPAEIAGMGLVNIGFGLPDAYSPKSKRISADERELGL
ncbi:MAG: glycosyltransferase family 4 protein, partial [Lachnospiraceae bacterium]|nr:glycosyltransferase family 4 protein [Lachnospiraceae bacterium]